MLDFDPLHGHEDLDSLPADRWSVVHDVAVNASGDSVDHIVIGPSGIFVLDAKDLPGHAQVSDRLVKHNGRRTGLLAKVRREEIYVRAALEHRLARPVDVRPVLALRANELVVREAPLDVTVLRREEVTTWLRKLPTLLFPGEVAELERAVLDQDTWQPTYRAKPLRVLASGGSWRRNDKLFL
ncbi:MAG TPA: nuclease-related domain-containing protein [Actinomycetota bacterium]|nr:nuclease-related domain-containing protein [Actinomycetota bacterium]